MAAGGSAGEEADRLRRQAEELRRRADAAEKRAAAYEKGQRGEASVALVLDGLAADGYRHIDDVGFPGSKKANIDHVLVGPAGVFVIDAKEWGGRVEVRDGVLRHNGYRRTDKLETITSGTRAIEQRAGLAERSIYSMACLTGEARVPPTLVGDCTVVSLTELADGLRAMPARLTPDQVAFAYDRLDLVLERKAAKTSTAPSIVRRAAENARAGRPVPSAPVPMPPRRPRAPRPPRVPRTTYVPPRPAYSRARETAAAGARELRSLLLRLALGVVAVLVVVGGLQHYLADMATKTIPKPSTTSSTPPGHSATSHH